MDQNPTQGALRYGAWVRDRGVCALCSTDTKAIEDLTGGHKWEADHIVPLAEGGRHHLDNIRTLCRACHKAETAALRQRLRSST